MTDRTTSGRLKGIAIAAAILGSTVLSSIASAASPVQQSDRLTYVLLSPDTHATTMSGSTDDVRRAQALRTGRDPLLYVRSGGTAYVIRDAALLHQAAAIFEPQSAKGREQAALGSRQADLGARQAKLGSEQARLGARQANATPTQADELGHQQEMLGRQQEELGRQQDVLGRQQDVLGREQDRLGREADSRIRALVDDAVRRGVARRVD